VWDTVSDVYPDGDEYVMGSILDPPTDWFVSPGDAAFKTYVTPTAVSVAFLDPLSESTSDRTVVNTAKNGRVVPVKVT
jgi:hypothetical protein